ncbi:MAG: hypothetical protein GY937_12380 [bacterium]|nr:hypothetical protein [bacterium]
MWRDDLERVHFWAAAAVLLLIAGVLRFHGLDADPSAAVGRVFLSDEGWWAHNARNHYLFGSWQMDDWNQGFLLAPLHTLSLRASFELFGLGLLQARLVSAAAGSFAVALMGIVLRGCAGRRAALWGMGMLAINPFAIAYSRVALIEIVPLALMLLAVVLAAPGARVRALRDACAGAAAVGAALCKLNAAAFLPILAIGVAGWCLLGHDGRPAKVLATLVRRAASMATGAGLVTLVWFLALVQPNLEGWLAEVTLQSAANVVPRGAYLLTKGFALGLEPESGGGVATGMFLRLSLLSVLPSLVWALHVAVRALRQGSMAVLRSWTFGELLAATWVIIELGLLWMATVPSRRYLWLTVPCTILAAHALGHAPTAARRVSEFVACQSERWRAVGLGVVIAGVLAVYLRAPLASGLASLTQEIELGSEVGLSWGTLCAVVVIGLCVLGALLGPGAAWALRRTQVRWGTIALGLTLVGGASAGLRLAEEVPNRTYEFRRASNEIRAIVGEEAAVVGGAVDTLLLGAPNRTLIIRDWRRPGFHVYGLEYLDEVRPSYFIFDSAVDPSSVEKATRRVLRGLRTAVPSSSQIVRGAYRTTDAVDRPLEFTVVRLSRADDPEQIGSASGREVVKFLGVPAVGSDGPTRAGNVLDLDVQ